LTKVFRRVLSEVKVNTLVVDTIVPWEVRVVRDRVTEEHADMVRSNLHLALFNTATIVHRENFVVTVSVWVHDAVTCGWDMVVSPLAPRRRARVITAWVKDWDVAWTRLSCVWVWNNFYITKTSKFAKR
jgi:hypothetical protein